MSPPSAGTGPATASSISGRRRGWIPPPSSATPEAPTALYVVTHDAGGHAFTFYRSNSAASRYAPRDVPEAAIRAARMLHVSGISQAISTSACDAVFHAIAVAKAAGVQVSYDTNLRLALWPPAAGRGGDPCRDRRGRHRPALAR